MPPKELQSENQQQDSTMSIAVIASTSFCAAALLLVGGLALRRYSKINQSVAPMTANMEFTVEVAPDGPIEGAANTDQRPRSSISVRATVRQEPMLQSPLEQLRKY